MKRAHHEWHWITLNSGTKRQDWQPCGKGFKEPGLRPAPGRGRRKLAPGERSEPGVGKEQKIEPRKGRRKEAINQNKFPSHFQGFYDKRSYPQGSRRFALGNIPVPLSAI